MPPSVSTGENNTDTGPPSVPPTNKPARISYEEYKTIANTLIWQLQRSEGEEGSGTRRSELINWYLKEMEGEIDSVEQLADRKALVEKIIDRLMHHVSN